MFTLKIKTAHGAILLILGRCMTVLAIINNKSEFFISIAKAGIHSFIFLGVIVNGQPETLATAGKVNLIDRVFGKTLGKHSLVCLRKQ